MSKKDRELYAQAHGKHAMGLSSNEAREEAKKKAEKQIQREIYQYLKASGVRCIINPPMHTRSQLPIGHPDFTFVWKGVPICAEVKIWGEKPNLVQKEYHQRLELDGWRVFVVTSVEDVKSILFDII